MLNVIVVLDQLVKKKKKKQCVNFQPKLENLHIHFELSCVHYLGSATAQWGIQTPPHTGDYMLSHRRGLLWQHTLVFSSPFLFFFLFLTSDST